MRKRHLGSAPEVRANGAQATVEGGEDTDQQHKHDHDYDACQQLPAELGGISGSDARAAQACSQEPGSSCSLEAHQATLL